MTIAKIMQNHSFRATFSYAVGKSGARIIGGNAAPWLERDQLSDVQLKALIDVTVKQFMISADLNREIKRPVYHISIALPPHEDLSDENLSQLCESFTAALILSAQQPNLLKDFDASTFRAAVDQFQNEELHKYQYSIVRHVDADHAHAHIIASKINLETEQALSTSYDYYRAQKILRDLERQYGLSVLENSWEVGRKAETRRQIQTELETGRPSVQKQIQNVLDRAIAISRTIPELIEKLLLDGIGVRVDFTRTGKPKGISYILDDVPMAGNRLGNRYSFPGLQRNSGLSYETERDNDRIQELCQQIPLTPEERESALEPRPTENLDDLIEAILAEHTTDLPDLPFVIPSISDEQVEEAPVSKEFQQGEQSVTDLIDVFESYWDDQVSIAQFLPNDSESIQTVDRQIDAANLIESIAVRLFEYYLEIGEPLHEVNSDTLEWVYRIEVSGCAYLVSRDHLTSTYNVRCENSEMNLQLFQGITDRDLENWQDLDRWLNQRLIADAPPQLIEPEREEDSGETIGAIEFWQVADPEPQESEFLRQQRFAETIAAEIRWLAQIGNINGTHYILLQHDDHISLTRKDGQEIGRFPLDATQLPQGFGLTESDVERFQIIQQKHWAIEIGEAVLDTWRSAGAPQAIVGQQYDVSQADGLLYLHRKGNSKPILEISINSDRLPSGQQLTQNDYEYFEQARIMLRQNEIEHDR
ncbi:relaxase/mobilization nuclease family protein [Leptolyngbya sp. NIES-3755]|nr:relaxase/mobilization nuclease family protein [Leptolyngbya sp. NIES-3755]